MSTVLNVKIDKKLKDDAREVAKAMGLPLSTVVAAGLRNFVRTRSVTLSDEPSLRPEVEAGLKRIEEDIAKRRDLSPSFDNAADAMAYLNNL